MLTGTAPNADPKRRYTISETTKLLGICRNTLRSYTERQLIKAVHHSINGRTYYLGQEINRLYNETL